MSVKDCILLGATVGGCTDCKNVLGVNNVKVIECMLKFSVFFFEVVNSLNSGDTDRTNASEILLCSDIA
jgi:hypothetical protein